MFIAWPSCHKFHIALYAPIVRRGFTDVILKKKVLWSHEIKLNCLNKKVEFDQGIELFCMHSNLLVVVKQCNLGTYYMAYFTFVIKNCNSVISLIGHVNHDYIWTLVLIYGLKVQDKSDFLNSYLKIGWQRECNKWKVTVLEPPGD